jgi:hypothetical protein
VWTLILSSETPPGLAELSPLAKPECGRRSNSEYQHLAISDGIAQPGPGAIGRCEMRTVLRLEAIGNGSQLAPVRHCDRLTLDHEIEPFEIVTTCGENAMRVLSKILCFALGRSGAEMQRADEPHAEEWSHVRSAIRTHGGQPESSESCCACRAWDHSVATASLLLKRTQLRYWFDLRHLGSLSVPALANRHWSRQKPSDSLMPKVSRTQVAWWVVMRPRRRL